MLKGGSVGCFFIKGDVCGGWLVLIFVLGVLKVLSDVLNWDIFRFIYCTFMVECNRKCGRKCLIMFMLYGIVYYCISVDIYMLAFRLL